MNSGKQQRASEKHKSQHKHEEIRDGEVAVAKQVQIDNGIVLPPLPDDHQRSDYRDDSERIG